MATCPFAVAVILATYGVAGAHGELERSSPRANSVVTRVPDEVTLHMSESPDAAFSEIRVFDKGGLRVDKDDTRLLDTTSLVVGLKPLEPGTYTVVWQVTSVSDGHRTSGSFRFTVSGGGRLFLGTGGVTVEELAQTRPTAVNTLVRWGELVGLAIVAGAVVTLIVVWGPVLREISGDIGRQLRLRLRLLTFIGLAVLSVALVADVLQMAAASTSEDLGLVQASIDVLSGTQAGLLVLMRLVLLAALFIVLHRTAGAKDGARSRQLWLAAGLAALLLAGRSLESHAAASESSIVVFSVASDFVHLGAAAVWVGGLMALIVGLAVTRSLDGRVTAQAVRRFSSLAIVCVCLIGVTGLYNAWLEVASLRALAETRYGQVLMVKTGILMMVLGLAAVNLLGIHSELVERVSSHAASAFKRLGQNLGFVVRGEVTLALMIFVMTALLANLPVGRVALTQVTKASESPLAMPVLIESHGLNVIFGITPNQVGTNTFLLDLTDALGNPIERSADATVRLSRPDRDMSVDPLVLRAEGSGQFSAKSAVLSIVGSWVASLSLMFDNEDSVTIDYLFRIPDRQQERRSIGSGLIDFILGREPKLPRTGPLVPKGAEAEAGREILRLADGSMNGLSSLHECNNINGVVTLLDYAAVDRMRYAVVGGGEAIIEGDRQWYRRGDAPWEYQARSEEFRFPDFRYAESVTGVRSEGIHHLNGRPHHLVSFYSQRDDSDYWFWIDTENYRIGRLVMNVPPSHYMVSVFDRFDKSGGILVPTSPEDLPASVRTERETVICDDYLP